MLSLTIFKDKQVGGDGVEIIGNDGVGVII